MSPVEILRSIERGLDRQLARSDISEGEKENTPGLRLALTYVRSRIDALLDEQAFEVLDRALPAPRSPEEQDDGITDTEQTTTGTFEPVPSPTTRRQRRE